VRFDDIRYIVGQDANDPFTIMQATLRLFIRGVITPSSGWSDDVDGQIALHNLNHNFCEETATWECRDVDEAGLCVQWRMLPLQPKVKPDYSWEPVATLNITNYLQGWIEFNVTEDIISFFENSYLNDKSYLIKKVCEKEQGTIWFWSCEGGRCPELEIWLRHTCPTTPSVDACSLPYDIDDYYEKEILDPNA
jgi:hypothetical protein